MDDRQDITVPMPGELVDEIHAELGYGDSRSEWIRDACRAKLANDDGSKEGSNGESPDATAGA